MKKHKTLLFAPLLCSLLLLPGSSKAEDVTVTDAPVTEEAPAARAVPAKEDLQKLVNDTMRAFNKAFLANDFTEFCSYMSEDAQKKYSPELFAETFKVWVEQGVDLSPALALEPVFKPESSVDKEGMLNVKGYYASEPTRIAFQMKYQWDDDSWKLAGIGVNTEDAPGHETAEAK